jgi:uncharacterized protein YkwD
MQRRTRRRRRSATPTARSTDGVAAARRALVAAFLLALIAVPAAAARNSTAGQTSRNALAAGVVLQLNAIRTSHGLVPLRPSAPLAAAAAAHSAEMLTEGYFAHDSFDGSPFWKRLSGYVDGAPSGYWSVGENLLWSSPDVDATKALELWMASPEHRRNILTARWREIGVAAIHADAAPGTYGGRAVTVITTDFGVRR